MASDGAGSESLIGELMLARAVLEERGDLVEGADLELRSLRTREAQLRAELEEQGARRGVLQQRRERAADAARARGTFESVSSLVAEIAPFDPGPDAAGSGLFVDLLSLLAARFGLEVIDAAEEPLSPASHRVIERRAGASRSVEVLQRGYRLAGRVVRPALVRVTTARPAPGS
jgi:molecular chaperone GrpE